MQGLFIGRFQPFHRGHLRVVKEMVKVCDEIVIAIGSAQHGSTKKNPFTADEREEMIQKTLDSEGIKARIVQVEDIPKDSAWVAHVEEKCGRFNVVYAGHGLAQELMKEAGKMVHELPRYDEIEATKIRELMGQGDWESRVPKQVANYIKEHKLQERVKDVSSRI